MSIINSCSLSAEINQYIVNLNKVVFSTEPRAEEQFINDEFISEQISTNYADK